MHGLTNTRLTFEDFTSEVINFLLDDEIEPASIDFVYDDHRGSGHYKCLKNGRELIAYNQMPPGLRDYSWKYSPDVLSSYGRSLSQAIYQPVFAVEEGDRG